MESLKIILLCILSAVVYGILQDQITARVCVEYFTIAHPPVFETDDPTLLAFGWGTIATWWVGVLLGVPLALFARSGKRPPLSARHLLKPILILMTATGVCALIAGVIGYALAAAGSIQLLEPLASQVPIEKHQRLIADGAAHLAAYGCGGIGGVIVWIWAWRKRRRK